MKLKRKYLVAVALLAVLAVVFGLAGTVMPVADVVSPKQSSSSSDSVTHFVNPPTYDSGWVDIRAKAGQYVTLRHGLNTSEVVVDITGKQCLEASVGVVAWLETYGGTSDDRALSLVQTSDGGYALAGYRDSYLYADDFWLVKTGSAGNHLWNRTYDPAASSIDHARSLVQTSDGGYALAGYTDSWKGAGGYDFWLVRTESSGNPLWSQTYGGANSDLAYSLVQTSDGGYALAGYTTSYGAGSFDFWLVKTDGAGNALWNQTYGGPGQEYAYSVVPTSDGGYALAGTTDSDALLIKTDSAGNEEWNQTYGGTEADYAYSLIQTGDGGYALAGYTYFYGTGLADSWLVKVKPEMNVEHQRNLGGTGIHTGWSRTYGGTRYDEAYSLIQTSDGGYALAGSSGGDFWLVRTDSAGNHLWNKTYGGWTAYSLVQTDDGGYALAGSTGAYGYRSVWFVKTDSAGNPLWNRTYSGGTDDDEAYSLVQTCDGGYALAGYTTSYGAGQEDFWLVKSDVELGLTKTGFTNSSITLYRGRTDLDWNYVRVRIWTIQEPTWMFGDINQDGVVDAQDLLILSQNYGKTLSLLSLAGIIGILGVQTYITRKRSE